LRNLFMRMQRVAGTVAGGLGKVVETTYQGGETELDKDLVEELVDPLVHLVRNAVDHGLEPPEVRHAAGKPPQGRLQLKASRLEDVVQVEIADDGRGLDRQRILAKAVERGLAEPGADYSDEEVHRLILAPGFSTAAQVSDVSGRGVGLDVVATTLSRLGGELDISSRQDRGTAFILRLPPSRASADGITDGVVVEVGEESYVIPSLNVLELISPRGEDLAGMAGRGELLNVRGSHRPLLRLGRVLEVDATPRLLTDSVVVMVEAGGRQVGLVADSFQGQQQVVVRGLERRAFPGVRVVKGCAILGERLAMVLDVEAVAAAGGCLREAA
jgi:two-component system chemotaxis sensor kinase CheA